MNITASTFLVSPCASGKNPILCWSIIDTASAHSQLASILASFVFASIVLIVSNPPKSKSVKELSPLLYSSFVSFTILLFAADLFSILSGEETLIRSSILEVPSIITILIATLQLLVSMTWLFKEYEAHPLLLEKINLLSRVILSILLIYVFTTIPDPIAVKAQNPYPPGTILFFFVGPATIFFFAFVSASFTRRRFRLKPLLFEKACIWVSHFTLFSTLLLTVYYGILANISEQDWQAISVSDFLRFYWVETGFILLFILVFTYLYLISLPNVVRGSNSSMHQEEEHLENIATSLSERLEEPISAKEGNTLYSVTKKKNSFSLILKFILINITLIFIYNNLRELKQNSKYIK